MITKKTIDVWTTSDGVEHETEAAAEVRERRLGQLAEAMKEMPPVQEVVVGSCDFANGGGHKPWPVPVVMRTRMALLALVAEWAPYLVGGDGLSSNMSYIGRALSDFDTSPSLYGDFMRLFFCCDNQGREYGQPYYRNHPDEAGSRIYT